MRSLFLHRTRQEIERHNRIKISLAAYAYEYENNSIMSDAEYDILSKQIDVSISTGNQSLDQWWSENFTAYSGQWIHQHPNLERIKELYRAYSHKRL